jgi:hypothetical protein
MLKQVVHIVTTGLYRVKTNVANLNGYYTCYIHLNKLVIWLKSTKEFTEVNKLRWEYESRLTKVTMLH